MRRKADVRVIGGGTTSRIVKRSDGRLRTGGDARKAAGTDDKTDRKENGRTTGKCSAEGRPEPATVEGVQSSDSILG